MRFRAVLAVLVPTLIVLATSACNGKVSGGYKATPYCFPPSFGYIDSDIDSASGSAVLSSGAGTGKVPIVLGVSGQFGQTQSCVVFSPSDNPTFHVAPNASEPGATFFETPTFLLPIACTGTDTLATIEGTLSQANGTWTGSLAADCPLTTTVTMTEVNSVGDFLPLPPSPATDAGVPAVATTPNFTREYLLHIVVTPAPTDGGACTTSATIDVDVTWSAADFEMVLEPTVCPA